MRVTLAPADRYGCGHYRLIYPATALGDDIDVEYVTGFPTRKSRTSQRILELLPLNTDVVVLQRAMSADLLTLIPMMQAQGIAVVVDIDDDFSCLHHRHPARAPLHPRFSAQSNWRILQRACAAADMVTVSTPALAQRYGARGHAVVLPNCVPQALLRVPRDVDTARCIVYGWAGYLATHPDDLTVTRGGVAQALDKTPGSRFLVVGPGEGVANELGLVDDVVDATGHVAFADYPQAVAKIGVGIVPLRASKFNEAKSYLKGLEYAALGIPFVASPTAEYAKLAEDHVGLLADERPRDWSRKLTYLSNPDHAAEWSSQGRAVIRESHTYETNAWRWAEAWEAVIARRRHEVAQCA